MRPDETQASVGEPIEAKAGIVCSFAMTGSTSDIPETDASGASGDGPLAGVRVLELGSFIAGPFAGQLLGDYGAEIVKVEPPGDGDPMRRWGVVRDGESLWWPSIARNKRSVCIDLRTEAGRDLVRRLATHCDVVLENFRPGRLREWGLGYDALSALNPRLVMVHVSGFGQTGPRSQSTGFGSVGEAVGGIRYTTGEPGRSPSRTGISLGDALAALFAVVGALAALNEAHATGHGQEVDVAIYEAVLALMESSMADLELGGIRRERTGSILRGVAPSNVYPTADGTDLVIAANADSIFVRLCAVMGRPDLTSDPRFQTHIARGSHAKELDALISEWTKTKPADELLAALESDGVPAGLIFTADDMLQDVHYAVREMVVRRPSFQGWDVPMQGVVPKFSRTPGRIREAGPRLGADTKEVLCELGGLGLEEYETLSAAGVIA
jgi:crotonobetainyl-CoA:carnitine CoA-transferase CaiB-like acyl-CoA transferase